MDRARVLWVTTEANPEPRTGGALRSMRLVQALSSVADVHVVNLIAGLDRAAYCAASGAVAADAYDPQPAPALVRAVSQIARGRPLDPTRYRSPQAAELADVAARRGDLVVLEHLFATAHRPAGSRCAVLLQNVESERLAQVPGTGTLMRRALGRYEVGAAARLERALARDPRVTVVTVSDHDDIAVGGGTVVIPNGTDLPPSVTPVPDRGPLLFVGSMGYQPNVDAVRWWASDIHRSHALPPLSVVGRGAAEELGDLRGDASIDLVGEVDDVGPEYERARAVVVPLRSGAGTRLKILEAFAHGRPVVSTTVGAEGLPVVADEHLVLADTASDIAAALDRVLNDDALAARLGATGRALAESFGWPEIGRRFVDAVLAH